MEAAKVEVRFEEVSVEADVRIVGRRALPTLLNSAVNAAQVRTYVHTSLYMLSHDKADTLVLKAHHHTAHPYTRAFSLDVINDGMDPSQFGLNPKQNVVGSLWKTDS